MKTRSRLLLFSWIGLLTMGACDGESQQPSTPNLVAAPLGVVDEPLGQRYSLGLTLWHLGHDPEAIRDFHAFLDGKGVGIDSLLPQDQITPPVDARRILVEPELLPEEQRGGWTVAGDYLTSTVYDAGPTVTFPVTVDRAGLHRLWIRYYGYSNRIGLMRLKVRRTDRRPLQPLVNDEVYDLPSSVDGPVWKSILVDLEAASYEISLAHARRWWRLPVSVPQGYAVRKVDCLYLTDEIWADAPSEETRMGMKVGEPENGIQWNLRPAMDPAQWRVWRVRPISWEDAQDYPRLFELSREFWRGRVDEFARKEYPDDNPADFRQPERQVIFDDDWNMVANPVRIRRQVEALRSDLDSAPQGHTWYWLYPGEFESVTDQWIRQGTTLFASYGATKGTAEQDLKVEKDGTYHVWVRFRQINYQEIWRLDVTGPDGRAIAFVRDQLKYEADILPQSAWQKVGSLDMGAGGAMHFKFSLLPYIAPMTYRFVYDVFVTTDGAYKPQGTLRPPLSKEQYLARAARVGADSQDGCFLYVVPGINSISQDWWPREAERIDDQTSLPTQTTDLTMTRGMSRSVQLYLRSVREQPIEYKVTCGDLTRSDGVTFEKKVDWRVVGFVPLTTSRQGWSPAVLLHRRSITVPPYNVAQVWLTVDTKGLPGGDYSGQVFLRSSGLPDKIVELKIHVADFDIAPKQGVLVSGYTQPPEGEEYLRAFSECGLNVWPAPMSKADMDRWGIRLLEIPVGSKDPAYYVQRITELKALGLSYEDFTFKVRDIPVGTTYDQLKDFVESAIAIHTADPNARVSFNPGEAAKLATFELLDPYCEFWVPYALHTYYPVDLAKKIAIYSRKPWMWFTTPCYHDRVQGIAAELFNQIRKIPTMPGLCMGTAFFALYYPFRDPWDAGYEHLPDASVMMLPSRHGFVSMPAFEGIREGIQAANLARMVQERAAEGDAEAQALVAGGTVEELIGFLERKSN